MIDKLKFSPANSKLQKLEKKLKKKVFSFSTLSGHCCPFANECSSKAVEINGSVKIQDGPNTKFRCFSASQEVAFPAVYKSRKYNTDLIKSCGNNIKKIEEMISGSIPEKAEYIRVHVAGDMFTYNYFVAWMNVAKIHSNMTFYAYTKSIPFVVKAIKEDKIADNFIITASYGGTHDDLIDKHDLRYAKVVFSEEEANLLGLEIDEDDSHAAKHGPSFALLLHGTQPKGSKASEALKELKRNTVEV